MFFLWGMGLRQRYCSVVPERAQIFRTEYILFLPIITYGNTLHISNDLFNFKNIINNKK